MISAPIDGRKCCGTCKWLDVPPTEIRKDGAVKERYRFRVYHCLLPFVAPKFPACIRVERVERVMMAPYYGNDCEYHVPRSAAIIDGTK